MTNHRFFRIGFQLPAALRKRILATFPPRFQNVWADSITCAYKVTEEFRYPNEVLTACVYGFTRREDNEAVMVIVNGDRFRTDGIRFHITLSTKEGVARASAGRHIQRKEITYVPFNSSQIQFMMEWKRMPLWKTEPTEIQAIAA